jgi:sarcosine oxidase subunit beta
MGQHTADIVVVGGGVMGTSLAWHLARRRVGRVVLLEKSFLAAGSSGKSGAIVRQHYSNPLTAQLAKMSLPTYEHFSDVVGGPPVFTRTGMALIVKAHDRGAVAHNVAMQQSLGIRTGIVSAEEMRAIDPGVALQPDELAVWEPDAGYVESVQAVASYAQAFEQLGGEVVEEAEVVAILRDGDRAVGVRTPTADWATRTIVLTTGPWAARLTAALGYALPVTPCRTQVALFRKPAGSMAGVVYGDFTQGLYFKPTHGEMIHAGTITGEELNDPVEPDAYNEMADPPWVAKVRQRLMQRYPFMRRSVGRGGFGALYAITPDWHPILDRLPGCPGVYVAVGFSGHGFKLAPMIGQLMAELMVDGQATTLDISSLRATRFAENQPVTTPYPYGVMG